MADTIPFPRFESPGHVDREGVLSREFIDFLRLVADSTTDAATAAALDALIARVVALESASGDSGELSIVGSNGIQVFGSETAGFEIRGPDALISGGVPTLVAEDEIYTVPANRQVLFSVPIDIEGRVVVDGYLIEV